MTAHFNDLKNAKDFILNTWPEIKLETPKIALVLGSGLSDSIKHLLGSGTKTIAFKDIPYFSTSTVAGHKGELIYTKVLDTYPVFIMSGRLHFYEGIHPEQVVVPHRVLGMLGCKTIILTNASGAIGDDFEPGQLMVVNDHINLTGHSPLVGQNIEELGPRFVDMTEAYDKKLIQIAKAKAKELDVIAHEGVYAGVLGPCYETPAEIRMFKMMGAHAVGMSTVFEVMAARHMNMRVLTIACLTNKAAGLSKSHISHDEVMENNKKLATKLGLLLKSVVQEIETNDGNFL